LFVNQNDIKKEKKKKKKGGKDLILSEPQGFVQKTHVDADYKWSGRDPSELFHLGEELGKGTLAAQRLVRL
jgi:hypothetical protein